MRPLYNEDGTINYLGFNYTEEFEESFKDLGLNITKVIDLAISKEVQSYDLKGKRNIYIEVDVKNKNIKGRIYE